MILLHSESEFDVRFPLLVQFEFHPDSKEAATAAEYLHNALNSDPSVPGLRIPTLFTPDEGSGEPAKPRVATEADSVLVVLFADDHLAVASRKPTKCGRTWGDYAVKLRLLAESGGHRFMPVQLNKGARPIDERLNDLNFLQAWTIDNESDRHKSIAREIVRLLISRLRPNKENDDAPPVTIFLSHAKADINSEPYVANKLLRFLTADLPGNAWFDSGDISAGSRFEREIAKGIDSAALLAVVTDSYSSRTWCRKEVLLAKQHHRPIVVVDSIQQGETRSFPYAGNVPVIRWNENPRDVVDLLLREALRYAYASECLHQQKSDCDVALPTGPELVTVVHRGKNQSVLYPDPPLGPEELDVIAHSGVRVETPLQRHALAHDLRSCELTVALSVSAAEDLGRYGLRKAHLDSIFLELSRYLLLAGVRLAYGGHIGSDSYTLRLAELLGDPDLKQQWSGLAPNDRVGRLVWYVPWPMQVSVQAEAPLSRHVDVIRCEKPSDVDGSLDTAFVAQSGVEIPTNTAVGRFAWSRGLTTMRERQSKETSARVVVGGKIGRLDIDSLYQGRMPGVLEEALIAIRALRPVYLVGAFGGCARLVYDALCGVPRAELASSYHLALPYMREVKKLFEDRGAMWDEFEAIANELKECGVAGLKNGLTVAENHELATSRSAERVVELILRGLRVCCPSQGYSGAGD